MYSSKRVCRYLYIVYTIECTRASRVWRDVWRKRMFFFFFFLPTTSICLPTYSAVARGSWIVSWKRLRSSARDVRSNRMLSDSNTQYIQICKIKSRGGSSSFTLLRRARLDSELSLSSLNFSKKVSGWNRLNGINKERPNFLERCVPQHFVRPLRYYSALCYCSCANHLNVTTHTHTRIIILIFIDLFV